MSINVHLHLQKIVLALYTLLNSLTARTAKGSGGGAEGLRTTQSSIYEMWFSLFVSASARRRGRAAIEAAEASRSFTSSLPTQIDDPLTASARHARGRVLSRRLRGAHPPSVVSCRITIL